MKIGIISTMVFTSPSRGYAGLEEVVGGLAQSLEAMGNEVTLICAVGSQATFKERWPNSKVNIFECEQPSFQNPEQPAYDKYRWILKDFDVVLDHTWQFWTMNSKAQENLKIIKVLHGLRPWGSKPPIEKPCLCGVSKFHRDYIKTVYQTDADYAYNGIDLSMYPFQEEKEDYLVFLSRMSYYKGALQFIDLCKKANMKGVLMGSDQYVEDPNFVMEVMRRCDGKQISYMGEVSHDLKIHYLKNAKALISPLLEEYSEVFGLNLVEANACGTPVIATASGAVPEVIQDMKSGFVTENVPEMLERLNLSAHLLRPKDCRQNAERFSKEKCAERYMVLIRKVLNGEEW